MATFKVLPRTNSDQTLSEKPTLRAKAVLLSTPPSTPPPTYESPDSKADNRADSKPRNGYQYKPLPTYAGTTLIRVIELLPKPKDSAALTCRIRTVDLAEKPDYEAISYCWGPPVFDQKLVIENEGVISITKSLQGALKHLRRVDGVRTIWADAVCINQQDVEERNAQVQLMRDIYRSCKGVIAWLGPSSTMTDLGMDTVPRVLAAIRKKQMARDGERLRHLTDDMLIRYGFPLRNSWVLHCIFSIFERPWFRRVWIIQELALAPRALLLCGRRWVNWQDFVTVTSEIWGNLVTYSQSQAVMTGRYFADLLIQPTKEEVALGITPQLLQLVARAGATLATDSRDKVFALIGLAEERGEAGVLGTPDYLLPAEEVYKRFVVDHIARYGNLDVLSVVHRTAEDSTDASMPTWVPDLSELSTSDPITRLDKVVLEDHPNVLFTPDVPQFAATRGSTTILQPTTNPAILQLRGTRIDTITSVGHTMRHRNEDEDASEYSQRVRNTFASWEHVIRARSRKKYFTHESMLQVYWQTMHGGMTKATYEICKGDFATDYVKPLAPYRRLTFGRQVQSRNVFSALERLSGILSDVESFVRVQCGEAAISDLVVPGITNCRKMGKTASGRVALLPGLAQMGDEIVLLEGGKVPFVVRRSVPYVVRQGGPETWMLVGEAYVHGIMYGEAWEESAVRPMCFE
ncbi:HET-domain-containing protein [Microthyrium microscopicum]|uniref:HET-domain-containing protein n=1 Tax=Microthyrium microscopicum TaxID=703497 RepID=A0A6A6UNL6_9PEZI|nr:HET-domain-containing protein [Microthyrium microscopicum]